jgi:CRISPR-associated protein Csx3
MADERMALEDRAALQLDIGSRPDFARRVYSNPSGLQLALYENGGTIGLYLDGLMVNQVEGHSLQGGLDRVYLRTHDAGAIECHVLSGAAAACTFHEHGAVWRQDMGQVNASMQMMLHAELPILYRVCHAQNNSAQTVTLDWLLGQDLGLADTGMLKNNEAYVCQYLDHRIAAHSGAGQVVFSRNNLHPEHPFALNCCMQGAVAASTDGYQFFGTASKLNGAPDALQSRALENRARQYEFAYAALQSQLIELQPGQSTTTVFALHVLKEHPQVTSTADLAMVDEVLACGLPEPGNKVSDGSTSAFFCSAPLLCAAPLSMSQLQACFAGPWRHEEYSEHDELYSFFCGDHTHVVLPAKEAVVERPHGTVLRSAHGVIPGDNILSVTCYGYGVFGSQLSLGNSTFGRFSTLLRNSLNLERSSGIRLFASVDGAWQQLGFPSAFAMERDRVRWIYQSSDCCFEVVATATTDTLEYAAVAIRGVMPALRMTWEVCGDANEFDGAPQVQWDAQQQLLSVSPTPGSMLRNRFPATCLLAKLATANAVVGGAALLGGRNEPYVVMEFPTGEFTLTLTGHSAGNAQALVRLAHTRMPDWSALMAHFALECASPVAVKLSDTINWYAHNAMIHYAAPRGMEQYGTAAWGTRDVCQGALEFLLALGHDAAVAEMLYTVFAHQYAGVGTWPQWFMFDDFSEIQGSEAHGDIVFWPIKALCDYVEQTGDVQILEHTVCYTDPASCAFTTEVATVHEHLRKALAHIYQTCIPGTALPCYGNGDWNDSLQPADPAMKTRMVSGWTAGLAVQALSALASVWNLAGYAEDAAQLDAFLLRLKQDFRTYILKDDVTAGFVLFAEAGTSCLLHPSDTDTGIHYRLLPINQAISSELFSPAEVESHLDLVSRHLKFPDGVRLMDKPPQYSGGNSVHFQRAETAAHFGREIGLLYVHANIRYCEALAKVGRADELLEMLQIVSPVALADVVPNARPRQANLYFTSSDAQVYDRYEAAQRMDELKEGRVGALGGWRLYSSGPGIYIGLVITQLFGLRRSHGRVVIDPVLPKSMHGAQLCLDWQGKRVRWIYRVVEQSFSPTRILVNGLSVDDCVLLPQAYRSGGLSIDAMRFNAMLDQQENVVEIFL